jgi:hypothetical protein
VSERADRREEASRDAIAKTAAKVREAAAKGGVHMTQTEATARVLKARERGDNIRSQS